ncbi:MAG: N-6 DNA methylase [Candidatus Lokiarchaeota archaeon]|nr:N-6 DNA methylase [Candidatus Lokiarchaeota archaeon]
MEKKINIIDEKIKLKQLITNLINITSTIKKKNIENNSSYIQWKKKFYDLYNKDNLDVDLYLYFSIIYYMGYILISKFSLGFDLPKKSNILTKNYFQKIYYDFSQKKKEIDLFTLGYFNYILEIDLDISTRFLSILWKIIQLLTKLNIEPELYFDFIVQNIIPKEIRHDTGEFYTPFFLVQKMVDHSYIFGEKVLDPCCGSGNFLIIIIRKILNSDLPDLKKKQAINNLYGFDINPVSIYMAKINIILLLSNKFENFKINIFNLNSLYSNNKFKDYLFDLIIGNPPWYTFRDIDSIEKQEIIRNLVDKMEIKPSPKNILNIEISTVFFYSSYEKYMKTNSKIFFVITKGVITGSHTSRFRNFRGFESIEIWNFNNSLKKVFPVDFICLFARKSNNNNPVFELRIPCYNYIAQKINDNSYNLINYNLKLESKEILVPYNRVIKGNKIYIKRLVTQSKKEELFDLKESIYKSLFRKGADLNPRNLIFVNVKSIENPLVKINPDERIFKRAKKPWNKIEFRDEIVDKKNIFNVLKSTELLKFYIYNNYKVFLPIDNKNLKFDLNTLNEYSRSFYNKINKVYLRLKKTTTKNKSLMDNLNRWGKLLHTAQSKKIKVIYNNSGGILKSAVIQGNYIISGDLSYYSTDNLEEAYYLSAILNSNLITNQIQIIKSSRHIFKKPFNFPIRKFNPQNKNHRELASLSKKAEKEVIIYFSNLEKKRPTTFFFPKGIINNKISQIINDIDNIVKFELSS